MALEQRMIERFEPGQVKTLNGNRVLSFGTSSYGYDIRCSNEFKLYVTLEFSNTTPLPAKIYANEGVAQVIFLESAPDDTCEVSYKDRGGKYQGQVGVTPPKV